MATGSFPLALASDVQQANVPADRPANVPHALTNGPAAMPGMPSNSTAPVSSSRRHSRGQKSRRHAAEPPESRKLKQKKRQNKHYRWRRRHKRQGHQPPPPSPSDPSVMCLETGLQETVGAYVSYDEQKNVQPTQSDEQLAWQLHQELLLERQPRRAAACRLRQVVCNL